MPGHVQAVNDVSNEERGIRRVSTWPNTGHETRKTLPIGQSRKRLWEGNDLIQTEFFQAEIGTEFEHGPPGLRHGHRNPFGRTRKILFSSGIIFEGLLPTRPGPCGDFFEFDNRKNGPLDIQEQA